MGWHPVPQDISDRARDERWQRLWSHREQLLKIARRRSSSVEDAEDAVHEALLRAWESPDLDVDRVGAWLTAVTVRLCVDRHRQLTRESEARHRSALAAPSPVPMEDVVCDRAEALWLARRSGELPARQAEALWLKSADLDVEQVAQKMDVSYRTVESLLARARRTLRKSLAGTLVCAGWLCCRALRLEWGGAQTVVAVSTAATLTGLGCSAPYLGELASTRVARSSLSQTVDPWALPGYRPEQQPGGQAEHARERAASHPGRLRLRESVTGLDTPEVPGPPVSGDTARPPGLPDVLAESTPPEVPDASERSRVARLSPSVSSSPPSSSPPADARGQVGLRGPESHAPSDLEP